MPTKKHLGQHWLKDRDILEAIADSTEINSNDTILEIGPGLGTLTSVLLKRAKNVIAVEYDEDLAKKLPKSFPGKNLEVINQDILQFDFGVLSKDYIVVANVPYYITSKIVQRLCLAKNPPKSSVLLVQKEVAQRMCADIGEHSLLSISTQIFFEAELGDLVGAEFFTPPPKVDSQVAILKRRKEPLIKLEDQKLFFRVAKAGFMKKRKKIRSSLSAGLGVEKHKISEELEKIGISPDLRAEDLSIEMWQKIATNFDFLH